VSLGRQEESHSSSCRRADLLTVSCDQVHKLALLKQACLTARCGLLLLRRVMTPTCYSCTKLESAACSSLRHVDIRRRHAACNLKSALNTSMHHDFRRSRRFMMQHQLQLLMRSRGRSRRFVTQHQLQLSMRSRGRRSMMQPGGDLLPGPASR